MAPFHAKRAYLLLDDDEFDALYAKTKARWAPCNYLLIALEIFGPAALVFSSIPVVVQLSLLPRLAAGALVLVILWFGSGWLSRILQPLRVASVKSAMLRHLARADAS